MRPDAQQDKPRNTLDTLNDHLFMQLARLNEKNLQGDKLQDEIARAKAISSLAAQTINNGSLVLRSQEFMHEYGLFEGDAVKRSVRSKKFPPMLKAEILGD